MASDTYTKSLMTQSEDSSSAAGRSRRRNEPLHERLSMKDMQMLKKLFETAHNNKMTSLEFREMLHTYLNVDYDDDAYNILFLKMDTSRTGAIGWDELLSHLMLGYFSIDAEQGRKALQLPIMGLPVIIRSHHRHPISKICFCPDVAKDRTTDPLQGMYLTISRDGFINWWSIGMKLLRSALSGSPNLKVVTTWVVDMVSMPDVNVIAICTTERELRFYDCTGMTFSLRVIITSWENMLCSMYYHFDKDINEECMLICGDAGGNIRILLFSAEMRGPFRSEAGTNVKTLRHLDLQKNPEIMDKLRLIEYKNVHSDWVRQVSYYKTLHCVVSCATCSDSLLMRDLQGSKTYNMFRVEKGIQCFAFDEDAHVIVTGGPDRLVRVWTSFVTAKPNITFVGHHSTIMSIVLQNRGNVIYSMSRDRMIKVWEVSASCCVQTYIDVPSIVGERSAISTVYNPATREFIMGAIKIAIVVLDEQLNPLHTDGFTHSRAVSQVLYNPLFKIIVTCGFDSIIINWNPVNGKTNLIIRDAHVQLFQGQYLPVEITAACFDSAFMQMVTGARNGELKVWNFNTGICVKTMSIKYMCEVTNCFWIDDRILAVGWDRKVTEFDASSIFATGKSWEKRHQDDVLAAAVRPPFTVATASYNSELILWQMDTGQPYRKFSCTDPTLRIKMGFVRRRSPVKSGSHEKHSAKKRHFFKTSFVERETINTEHAIEKAVARRVPSVTMPAQVDTMRQLAVQAMIFLQTRAQHSAVASLMVSVENGNVQCWSDHSAGGFKGSFQAIHTAGDCVSCFATDLNNEFLFTGTTQGYLKVWLMTNFLNNKTEYVNMPRLRLIFPFLWRDRVEGRAKRRVRDQPKPLLLNSYRAHLRCINTVAYIDEYKIVFTGSSDYSVRLWRLSGEYLQTLGSFLPWTLEVTRHPPDIKKIASSTTLKVLNGGQVSYYVPGQKPKEKVCDITSDELIKKTYGKAPGEPLLGRYWRLPSQPDRQDPIKLDISLPKIPLYTHLRMASTLPVRRPPTPEQVLKTRLRESEAKKAALRLKGRRLVLKVAE